ncbi:MAG: hypothetical protein PVH84_05590 [Candidatus Aminicenantes bacterium]|jgi:hypothetical protein
MKLIDVIRVSFEWIDDVKFGHSDRDEDDEYDDDEYRDDEHRDEEWEDSDEEDD